MAPSGGTAFIDIVPDFRQFQSAMRVGMRAAAKPLSAFGDAVSDDVTGTLRDAGRAAQRFADDAVGAFRDSAAAAADLHSASADAADGLDDLTRADDDLDQVAILLGRVAGQARDARDEFDRLSRIRVPDIAVGVDIDTGEVRSALGKVPDRVSIKADIDASGATAALRALPGEADKAGEGVAGSLRKWSASLTTLAAGAALLIVAPWIKALSDATQWDTAFAGMEAALGQRGKDVAQRAGKIAAQVYVDAWGSTIAETGAVTARVIRDLPKAIGDSNEFGLLALTGFDPAKDADEIERATSQVFAIAGLLGEDTSRVINAARQLITTGLADDWMEALDLIGYSSQELNDPLNELLDTFIEYPTQFRKLGLSGEKVIGFLDALVESGAPSLDKAADALKEFSIRAVDGSETTASAFQALGLAPDAMAEEFAAGGPRAAAAFASVISAIQDAARQSPLAGDRIGVALFGTQWEDLGASILSIDPAQLQVASDGAAQQITDALGGSLSATFESAKRTIFQSLTALLTDPENGLAVTARRSIESGFAGDQFDFSGSMTDALSMIMEQVTGVWQGTIAPERAGQIVAALLTGIIDAFQSLFSNDRDGKASTVASNMGTFFSTVWNDPQLRQKLDELKGVLLKWYADTVLPVVSDLAARAGAAFATGLKNALVSEVKRALSGSGGLIGLAGTLLGWNGEKTKSQQPQGRGASPVFLAEGGIVSKPTLSVIGEAGPEAVVPLRRMDTWIDSSSSKEKPLYLTVRIGERDITSMIEQVTRDERADLTRMLSAGRRVV